MKKTIPHCRLCNAPTSVFLDLGRVPLPEEFRLQKDLHVPIITYPLRLSVCHVCHHIQLADIPNVNTIYKKNYFYDFSVTMTGHEHWKRLSRMITTKYRLTPRHLVVDIGSNTGALLSEFRSLGVRILGVDPSPKVVAVARKHGIPTMLSFFRPAVAQRIVRKHGQAHIVTTTNVFDHVQDLGEFVTALDILLDPQGAAVIEVPYAFRMIRDGSHTPYLQQLDYMLLTPLQPFFANYGFSVTDASEIPLHGGSIRITLKKRPDARQSTSMKRILDQEQELLTTYQPVIRQFGADLLRHYRKLAAWVHAQRKKGARIAGVGASAKGMTLLSCAGLGPNDIDFITEKSELKIGRFSPSGIPIVSDADLLNKQPDIALALAWNFVPEIQKNLAAFTGTWHIPMPMR